MLLVVDLVVWTMIAIPGVVVGLLIAWLRFDLSFAFNWPLLVFASLLVTIAGTSVGYAIAVSMRPMLAQLIAQGLALARKSTRLNSSHMATSAALCCF